MAECLICHRVLNEDDDVLRVERFTISSRGTEGTQGWSSTNQQFVHLSHLTDAFRATRTDPGKGKW